MQSKQIIDGRALKETSHEKKCANWNKDMLTEVFRRMLKEPPLIPRAYTFSVL